MTSLTVGSAVINYSYDSNGSVSSDGLRNFEYDRPGRLSAVKTLANLELVRYNYDQRNHRVRVATDGEARQVFYLRDSSGRVSTEYGKPSSAPPEWRRDYVYALGRLVAVIENLEPQTPTGITSSTPETGTGPVTLNWFAPTSSDVYGYDVYRATLTDPNAYSRLITAPPSQLSYSDTTALTGQTYLYKLVAVDTANLESPSTTSRKIKIGDLTPPSTPATVEGEALSCTSVALSWSPSSDTESDLAGYNIYRRVMGESIWPSTPRNGSLPRQSTLFVDSTGPLAGGGPFEYAIEAVDAAGRRASYAGTIVTMPPLEECGGGGAFLDTPLHAEPEYNLADYRVIGQSSQPAFRIRYVHVDHLGSQRLLTDSVGSAIAGSAYFPFGEPVPGSTFGGAAPLFAGYEHDAVPYQHYLLARSYGIAAARFVQVDPLEAGDLLDPQSWNRYSYVRNRPIANIDPDGMQTRAVPRINWQHPISSGGFPLAGQRFWGDHAFQPGGRFLSGGSPAGIDFRFYMITFYQEDPDAELVVDDGLSVIRNMEAGVVRLWSVVVAIRETLGPERVYLPDGREITPVYGEIGPPPGRILAALSRLGGRVANQGLANAFKALFQTSDKIPGGTAGAIRLEAETGELVGGVSHVIKGMERARQLEKLIARGELSPGERELARALLDDLREAFGRIR